MRVVNRGHGVIRTALQSPSISENDDMSSATGDRATATHRSPIDRKLSVDWKEECLRGLICTVVGSGVAKPSDCG